MRIESFTIRARRFSDTNVVKCPRNSIFITNNNDNNNNNATTSNNRNHDEKINRPTTVLTTWTDHKSLNKYTGLRQRPQQYFYRNNCTSKLFYFSLCLISDRLLGILHNERARAVYLWHTCNFDFCCTRTTLLKKKKNLHVYTRYEKINR